MRHRRRCARGDAAPFAERLSPAVVATGGGAANYAAPPPVEAHRRRGKASSGRNPSSPQAKPIGVVAETTANAAGRTGAEHQEGAFDSSRARCPQPGIRRHRLGKRFRNETTVCQGTSEQAQSGCPSASRLTAAPPGHPKALFLSCLQHGAWLRQKQPYAARPCSRLRTSSRTICLLVSSLYGNCRCCVTLQPGHHTGQLLAHQLRVNQTPSRLKALH